MPLDDIRPIYGKKWTERLNAPSPVTYGVPKWGENPQPLGAAPFEKAAFIRVGPQPVGADTRAYDAAVAKIQAFSERLDRDAITVEDIDPRRVIRTFDGTL